MPPVRSDPNAPSSCRMRSEPAHEGETHEYNARREMRILPPDAALRLAAIVESSDDAIVSKDLNGIITSWNWGAERLFGYSADEAVGRSITMLIPSDRLAEEDMVLARIRRGERVEHFDTVRRRKDGSFVDISLTVSPIRDTAGTIVGASKIARNISDRTSMEAELRDSHHRLMTLALASASIVGSPNVDEVLSGAIDLAREVFPSDGYAIWHSDETGLWRIARSWGISDEFASRVVREHCGQPLTPRLPFTAPLVSEDIATLPMSAAAREAYRQEGIAALLVLPLLLRGERRAAMTFYSRRIRRYDDLDVQFATVVANLAAASLTTAELYRGAAQGPRSRRSCPAGSGIPRRSRHGPQRVAGLRGDAEDRRPPVGAGHRRLVRRRRRRRERLATEAGDRACGSFQDRARPCDRRTLSVRSGDEGRRS